MKKLLANKRGEGYINTAVIIIIAVVLGGLLLGGLYLIFAGDNGVIEQVDNNVYDMFNTGEEITLKHEGEKLLYSYDGETWKESEITGMSETGRVTKYVTMSTDDGPVHLVAIVNGSDAVVCRSVDGKTWLPVRTAEGSISLILTNAGKGVYVYYENGRSYTSTDGLNWNLYTTKLY